MSTASARAARSSRSARAGSCCLTIPATLARYLAYKGSITVNGVSLTVNRVTDLPEGCVISINLIPHTVQNTALGQLAAGDPVNLEIDLIARYVERMLGTPATAQPQGTT
jgi:riboflavin synthase